MSFIKHYRLCNIQHFLCLQPFQGILREKEHSDPVASRGAEIRNSDLGRGSDHQLMRDLHHETHAVPCLSARVLSCPMLQLFHNLQRIIHSPMGLFSPNADHGSDAAGIMFKRRVIQRKLILVSLHHGLPVYGKGPPAVRQTVLRTKLEQKTCRILPYRRVKSQRSYHTQFFCPAI